MISRFYLSLLIYFLVPRVTINSMKEFWTLSIGVRIHRQTNTNSKHLGTWNKEQTPTCLVIPLKHFLGT